jgi:threonine/homoserine/homoserine lactone efflux protein
MDFSLLFRGLIIGFSIAAPVGPIGVLCIRRTLTDGRSVGLVSGLGAATADALYGCVAGFGLTFISGTLINQKLWLQLFGGLFLLYLGIKTLFSKPSEQAVNASGSGLFGAYASTFLLTVTNPLTILSFAAIFAALGLSNTTGSYASALVLVLGVFLGSAVWWLLLTGGVGFFRDKFNTQGLLWVNRISGVTIMVFGVLALIGLLRVNN